MCECKPWPHPLAPPALLHSRTCISAPQILPSSQTPCVPVGLPVFFDIALEPVNVLIYFPKNLKLGWKRTNSFPQLKMRIFLGHREKFIGLRDNRSLKPSGLKKIVMKVVSDPVARRSGASLIKRESPYGSRQQFIWTRRVFCLTPAPPAPDTGSVSKEAL